VLCSADMWHPGAQRNPRLAWDRLWFDAASEKTPRVLNWPSKYNMFEAVQHNDMPLFQKEQHADVHHVSTSIPIAKLSRQTSRVVCESGEFQPHNGLLHSVVYRVSRSESQERVKAVPCTA
jgi:hypothetical protein